MNPDSPSFSPMTPKTPASEAASAGPSVPPAQVQDVGSSRAAPFEAALRDPHLWSVVWWTLNHAPVDEVPRNVSPACARDELGGFMAGRGAWLVRKTEGAS